MHPLLSAPGVGSPATLPVECFWSNGKFRVMAQPKVLSQGCMHNAKEKIALSQAHIDSEIILNEKCYEQGPGNPIEFRSL